MGHHQMQGLIEQVAVLKKQRPSDVTKEAGGILITGPGNARLHSNYFIFAGGEHVEPHLLKASIVNLYPHVEKIYLFTYFAPCPECAQYLLPFPRMYSTTKFMLAYWDPRPIGARYSAAATEDSLSCMHIEGWKVRHWTSGDYHDPQKLPMHPFFKDGSVRQFGAYRQ